MLKRFLLIITLVIFYGCSKKWTKNDKRDVSSQIIMYSIGVIPKNMSNKVSLEFDKCVYNYVLSNFSPDKYYKDKARVITTAIGVCEHRKEFQKYFPLASVMDKINRALENKSY